MTRMLSGFIAASTLLLSACATIRVDGDAVECPKCHTMWVRLFAESAAPGFYLLGDEEDKRRACPRCRELAVSFFESGVLLRCCPDCRGRLSPRTVSVVR